MNNLAQRRISRATGTDSKFTAARREPLMRTSNPKHHWKQPFAGGLLIQTFARAPPGVNANVSRGTSVADKRPECLADVEANHEIGQLVLIGGLAIDDHELRTAIPGHHGEAGGRPDHER